MACEDSLEVAEVAEPDTAVPWFAWEHPEVSRESDMTVTTSRFISVLPIQ